MEDKEKQIEEMVKDIQNAVNGCAKHWAEVIAKYLTEQDYRKLPENAFILTDDNAEELANLIITSPQMQSVMGDLIKAWQKETAEKFAKDLLSIWGDLEKWSEKYYEPHSGITPAHIKERAKQFGVEIKE